MPLFERDASKHKDASADPRRDSSAAPVSVFDAEDSAAHIAELVRRTAERQARPGPSSIARPDASAAAPAPPPRPPLPASPGAQHTEEPLTSRVRHALRQPSRRTMGTTGAVAAALIAGGLALSGNVGSEADPTSKNAASAAPAGYAVKVTDVITDCVSHSRGGARALFESQSCTKATRTLATGQVSGRPTLFVSSRVQMASLEAAASLKQVLDGTGTGNLNDLLREGKTFPGAPATMPSSGYASVQSGAVVLVAEAGFSDGGPSSNTSPALRAAAAQVAALVATAN